MKKLIVSITMTGILLFNTVAYAAGEGVEVNPGITPDSILYTVDKLLEDLQFSLASNTEKEAELLLKFAQERLAEAKKMTTQEKSEFVQAAIEDYIKTIDKAQEKVAEVITSENIDDHVKEKLNTELEEGVQIDEKVKEELTDDKKEELSEKTEEIVYTAKVVKGIDKAVVQTLREEGLGFGQIAKIALLSETSGKSIDEIAVLITEKGMGLGNVAKELGVHPSGRGKWTKDRTDKVEEDKDNKESVDDIENNDDSADINDEDTTLVQLKAQENTKLPEVEKLEVKKEVENKKNELKKKEEENKEELKKQDEIKRELEKQQTESKKIEEKKTKEELKKQESKKK